MCFGKWTNQELFIKKVLAENGNSQRNDNMYGDAVPSERMVCKWVFKVKSGRTSTEDDRCSGCQRCDNCKCGTQVVQRVSH